MKKGKPTHALSLPHCEILSYRFSMRKKSLCLNLTPKDIECIFYFPLCHRKAPFSLDDWSD